MIHVVANFPAPATPGRTNCGKDVSTLTKLNVTQVEKIGRENLCRRCEQLTGIV